MADSLIFPIKFDLEKGVIEAGKDADKYLRQLENTLRQKPIKLDVAIDGAAPGSIDAISKRMAALSTEFNKLAEAQRVYNRASGEFTPEAQKIIKEYAELTAATQTYAQSLSQITAAAKRQTQEQMKAQEQEIKRYEEYWKRKEAENAKQAQQEVANAERARKAQQQRISQEQAADTKRYQEWLRQKNQEAVENERVERQKQQSRERTIAQQNREFAAQRQAEQQRQQAISASLRAEYQRIEAKKQAEAASRRELQMLNQQYAAEERRRRLADSQASIAKRQQVVKTLRAEENTIVNITAKLQHWQQVMNSSAMDGRQFKRAAEEVQRLSQKLSEAQARISQLTTTTSNASARQSAAVRQVNEEFKKQDSYVWRLMKRLAVYASFSTFGNFLTKIREVTAQFELQRVSLGAIIQDQQKANQLFSEIKSFALKSPVSILDLTKYTKQLAAYKIGVDELFETTKKLTDVSVGLGVSMDRVVLAYGQTRATGYLRASEIRQFTEMGVPIVEELASKLSKMNGELVTAAQVMDMVSERAISFELVKEVFNDMTSAGGMFYNMQEKQGNTLYGMWAKLGDAASVMYDQIGNTGIVNGAMKWLIQAVTDLMKHWRFWGNMIMWVGGLYLANAAAMKVLHLATLRYTAAGTKLIAVSKAKRYAALRELAAARNASTAAKLGANIDYAVAAAKLKAATATNVFTASLYRLWAAFLSNPLGWVIAAVGTLVALFADADDSLKQFEGSLGEIEERYTLKQLNDADNFKRLADGAFKAAEGSKEQREKLDELDRTYGKIVGSENLQIEKLRAMNGEYGSLIETIKEYNIQMKYSEREGEIKSFYGEKKKTAFADLSSEISSLGLFEKEVGGEAGAAIATNVQNALLNELEKTGRATMETAREVIEEQLFNVFKSRGYSDNESRMIASGYTQRLSDANIWYGQSSRELDKYVESLNSERAALQANTDAMEKESGARGQVVKDIRKAKEELDKIKYVDADGKALNANTMLYQQMVANETMKKAADIIRNSQEMKDALGDKAKELESEWLHLVDKVSPDDLMNITTVNFDAILKIIGDKYPDLKTRIQEVQKEWGNVAPTNATVLQIRNKLVELSQSFDPTLSKMRRFLWDGSGEVDDYLKRLKEQQEELKARLKEKQNTLLQWSIVDWLKDGKTKEQIKAEINELKDEINAVDQLVPFVTEYTNSKDKKSRSGRQSDPRLQILNEMVQLAEKLNKEYSDWEKKVGSTKALEKVNATYEKTVKYAEQVAKNAGISLPHLKTPTNAKELNEYLEAVRKVMETAKGLKGGKKAAIELAVKMSNNVSAEDQKAIEEKIKALADRISRTKTAKEFYDKVLGMTGDYDLAAKVSLSIYGDTGYDLQKQLAQQVRQYFQNDQVSIEIPVDVITADNQINYKRLGEFAEQMKKQLGEEPYKAIKKIAEEGQKDLAKTYEGYLKDLEKAKTYADKRIELARTTAEKIREINADIAAGNIDENVGKETIRGLQDAEDREAAKLEYEAFKDTPLYVQMFEDLEHASTSTLEMMKQRLTELSRVWGVALDPTQLKEIQSRMNEIDGQLRTRNPFKTLKESYQQYRAAVGSVSEKGALANVGAAEKTFYQRSEDYGADSAQARAAEKELKARRQILEISQQLVDKNGKRLKGQNALNKATEIAFNRERDKRALLEMAAADEQAAIDRAKAHGKDPNQDPDVIAKREALATAREEYEVANRTSEILQNNAKSSKTLKESMGEVAQQAVQFLQMGADIARGIADISEAMGANEEDVQYWNDVADALSEITAGVQDIVSAALKGDVMSVITGIITAIPKMFVGFANLFSAGKIRDANKEIKKQEELLKDLEYTYGRLEKAADKLFGGDYIQNFNQRLRALQAQQKAYEKQAEAERSKGKKEDKEKTKEYLESARDTMDEIADMQSELRDHFAGTDITSAARDFASAWIDAKTSFSDTTEAMRDKFKDMVQNMIIEAMAAKIMEHALQPFYKALDEAMTDGDLSAEDIAKTTRIGLASITDMNNGMEVMWEQLKAAGVDVGKIWSDAESDFTGIAKNFSGATSEEINSVAGIGNTVMYYVSPIPRMDENLVAIRAIMERGATPLPATTAAGWTDWQQQAMDNYNAIARNTADTVTECRRAAEACEKMARAIKTKGATSGFNVFLNS